MGGKKKLSLKQMERQQDKKAEEEEKKSKKEKAAAPKEKKPLSILPPDTKNEKILSEVKKMGVLTPYAVATRFNIRISAAKDFLDELEEEGKIHRVSGNHNIKIYTPN
ncbi:MAG: eS25 family ribosomal protein [Candidatus Bathyarchaeia archaeon]